MNKEELFSELQKLCEGYDPSLPTRITWDRVQSIRTKLLDMRLNDEEMAGLKSIEKKYCLNFN